MYCSFEDIVTLREIQDEINSFLSSGALKGLEKNDGGEGNFMFPCFYNITDCIEGEDDEELPLVKVPKKIKRSHLQKKKGRATEEPLSKKALKQLKQQNHQADKKAKGSGNNAAGKKALYQGLLVLRPSLSVAADDHDRSLPNLVVGRSSKQNERVTFDIGREHHLWFHVQVIQNQFRLAFLTCLSHRALPVATACCFLSRASQQQRMRYNTPLM